MIAIDESDTAHLPVAIDPEILSGAPVFAGMRVPVEALIGNLEAGLTLDEFLENFRTVSCEQVVAVLEFYDSKLAHAEERISGDPTSADNERIDADLAREYGATHK